MSSKGSDFLPVSFQVPVAVCILRVAADFRLQAIRCLDAPHFRPQKIVEEFWRGLAHYKAKSGSRAKLVTFNGRGFDLPLLELAAFRYGCCGGDYFTNRNRYSGGNIDLMDWLSNFGALRMAGGVAGTAFGVSFLGDMTSPNRLKTLANTWSDTWNSGAHTHRRSNSIAND